jgi:hypothetical protein
VDSDIATTTTIKRSIIHGKAGLAHLDERNGYNEIQYKKSTSWVL